MDREGNKGFRGKAVRGGKHQESGLKGSKEGEGEEDV